MKYFLSLLFISPLFAFAQPTQSTSMQLDSLFATWFKPGVPGAAVLIVKDGKPVYKNGFGIADINTKDLITSKTLFNLGSISKTFVSYGILKLAEEGRLSLEDELIKYFPDFENASIAKQVKIVHLLTHTSGLPDSRKVREQHEFYLTAKDEENFAPLKKTSKLEFEPGTRYKYSNPAFNGLALIIEKVTKVKWQDYISKLIFESAGMKTSTITDGPHPASGVSHAYEKSKEGKYEELDYGEEPTFAASGNGGVWSSVEELWKYEQAIQSSLFLSEEWIRRSRTVFPFPQWKDSVSSRLGLSWFLTKENGIDMIGHTGSQGGFISDYCWLPEKKLFYVLLCNYPYPRAEIREKLFALLQNNNWLD